MQFPFPGKTVEESARIISNKWDYSKPLLLKPKDGYERLTELQICEIRNQEDVRFKEMNDGRIFSLDAKTTDVLFSNNYTVDPSYVGRDY